ncbi:MAG: tetratricopeptide repeat protein [Candidatus Aminicenantes bacterium]|nr:MAG: tetratricopeptide repeat protein [Candidatus Aminicenantes bacterium]
MKPSSKHSRRKLAIGVVLFFGILASGIHLEAGPGIEVLVMPFKVIPVRDNPHQWLGRAVSFHITSGLQLNALPVLPDHHAVSILEANHIMFPYNITKASVIRIARDHRLSRVIWGEIALVKDDREASDRSVIQLRSFIINLSNYSQKYLPLIKGHIHDLYKIKSELLTAIVKTLKPGEQAANNVRHPRFNLNHRDYEIFIKSLLIKNIPQKIQLLEKAQQTKTGKNSDILNFELAKLYLQMGELAASEVLLEKIPADKENFEPWFAHGKIFLNGVTAYAKENITTAVEAFTILEQENQFTFEVHHNLGLIHLKSKDYKAAERHFQYALKERQDPGTWLYLVHVLLAGDTPQKAALQLNQALRVFPKEEKLVELFGYFISQSRDQALLYTVFQDYIPNLFLAEGRPKVALKLKNPFNIQVQKPLVITDELNETFKVPNGSDAEDIDSSIERLQELLEMNPFEPGYYRSISLLYLKKKEFHQAELHALALVFLEKTRENYLHLAKVYKARGNKKKAKEIKKAIDEKK